MKYIVDENTNGSVNIKILIAMRMFWDFEQVKLLQALTKEEFIPKKARTTAEELGETVSLEFNCDESNFYVHCKLPKLDQEKLEKIELLTRKLVDTKLYDAQQLKKAWDAFESLKKKA